MNTQEFVMTRHSANSPSERARRGVPGRVHKLFTIDHLTNHLIYDIIVIEREDSTMLQKNIEKEERKNRKTWQGYYTRKTPTKKEKEEKNRKKYRKGIDKDD